MKPPTFAEPLRLKRGSEADDVDQLPGLGPKNIPMDDLVGEKIKVDKVT